MIIKTGKRFSGEFFSFLCFILVHLCSLMLYGRCAERGISGWISFGWRRV